MSPVDYLVAKSNDHYNITGRYHKRQLQFIVTTNRVRNGLTAVCDKSKEYLKHGGGGLDSLPAITHLFCFVFLFREIM